MPDRVKVLLDTDIGSDIDDAVCLAYLLLQPRCDLLGITTVTGEPVQRARLASALCMAAGRDIPIFPGSENPILVPLRQKQCQQAERLASWPHDKTFPRGEAIPFLRSTIRSHPGEIVLLTVAPLTNIGLLFRLDPEIPALLRGLVMMCGRFTERALGNVGPAEWNAAGDPHATAIVYGARVRLHRSLGLDVTTHLQMTADDFQTTFARVPLFRPVLDWAEVWFRDWPGTTFHDPLAAVSIFEEEVCTFEHGTVHIELSEGEAQGRTYWLPGNSDAPHEIGTDVNPSRFFEHFLSLCQ